MLFVMIPSRKGRDAGIVRRRTSQREVVLRAICEGNHLSAREVFETVCRVKKMSFGTVYRNLQILAEAGEIVCVPSGPEGLRYDRRRERHPHLRCGKCGRVFDVPLPYRASLDREAAAKSGFVIEGHEISFTGLCRECAPR